MVCWLIGGVGGAVLMCVEILAHPWICMVSEDALSSSSTGTKKSGLTENSGMAARRASAGTTNLQGALRALSGHVNDRKLEKMASNFTRLVSLLQKDKADGQKLVKLLGDNSDGSGGAGGSEEEEDMASLSPILNTEIRDALVHVFKQLGEICIVGVFDQYTALTNTLHCSIVFCQGGRRMAANSASSSFHKCSVTLVTAARTACRGAAGCCSSASLSTATGTVLSQQRTSFWQR
jgi:hypothetical protein